MDSHQRATGSETGAAQLTTQFGIPAPFSAASKLNAAPDKGNFLKKSNRQRKFHWTSPYNTLKVFASWGEGELSLTQWPDRYPAATEGPSPATGNLNCSSSLF